VLLGPLERGLVESRPIDLNQSRVDRLHDICPLILGAAPDLFGEPKRKEELTVPNEGIRVPVGRDGGHFG